MSRSLLGRWLLLSFLGGVLLHSFWPYSHPSLWIYVLVLSLICVCLLCECWRWLGLIILMIAGGLWRFDATQATMPRGLIFGNAKFLAHMTITPTRTANHADPQHWLMRWRDLIHRRVHKALPGEKARLLTGLLYGARELNKTEQLTFRRAGLLHIIAVSGANITLVIQLLRQLVQHLRLSFVMTTKLMLVLVLFIVLFVGASASVVRAALMAMFILSAPLVSRLPHPPRLLLVAMTGYVAWRPWALAFDPSFALSCLAMAGLISVAPILEMGLTKLPNFLRNIVATTLGATMLTMPYALWAFGTTTLWALPTSLLVLPILPWTMLLGALDIALPWSVASLPVSGCLEIIWWLARLPERFGFGYWQHINFSFATMVLTYVLLWVVWRLIKRPA